VKRRYRSENPAAGTELPKVRVKPIQPLSFDQACTLLEAVAGHRWAPLYRLALNLGLREAELLGLTWDAVNFEQATLHVYQQLRRVPKTGEDGKEFVLQTTKTASSDRVLDLDVDLLADLRALHKNQLEERLLLGKRWKDTWG
jgi:integrase